VLTSGGDQIFPKGLPVGTVTRVGMGKDLFLNIKVRPAANLAKLEEVLVLVEKQQREATAEDLGHTRAADILATRLPSVPEKPPADGNAPAGTSTAPSASAAGNPTTAPAAHKPVVTPKVTLTPDGTATPAKPPSPSANPKTAPVEKAPATEPANPPANPADQPASPPAKPQPTDPDNPN